MSVELQIQSRVLGEITARAVQTQLASSCFPPLGAAFIDHADVVLGPLEPVVVNGAVRLNVPADVFVVSRDDVLAAPNGTPVGASAAAGRVALMLELRLAGAVLTLPVPGFADVPIAVATLRDGTGLLLDLRRAGKPRVARTFRGPFGAIEALGDWALATAGGRSSMYRVRRSQEAPPTPCICSCHQHTPRELS